MARSLDIIDPKRELAHDSGRDEESFENTPPEDGGGGGHFYLIIGIIAVIVAVGSALFVIYKDKGGLLSNKTTQSVTPTPAASASSETSPTASATKSASAQAGSTSKSAQFSASTIRIANGNGINGEALRIKKFLEGKGYKIASTGNATKTYTKTTIYYKSGDEDLAKALQSDLATEYSGDISESDRIPTTYGVDAVIALGAK
jgi:hypothetical protein